MVKGFTQIEGIHYKETFFHVLKFASICLLLTVAHLDVESFMSCHFRFHETIASFGLFMILEDHCVYLKRIIREIMFLILCVEDILLVGNRDDQCHQVVAIFYF